MFDILTIGTATRDVFLKSSAFKVLNDPKHLEKIGFPTGEAACFALGTKLDVEHPVFTTGGGAANAAVSFARYGLHTAAVIKVGDDDSGRAVIADLKKEGVRPIATIAKRDGTAYSTVLLTGKGERTILVYRGAGEHVSETDMPFKSLNATWVYIAPGKIPPALMQKIILFLKKKGTKIAMNPSRGYLTLHGKALRPFLKHLDVIIMNREEASYLTGVGYHREEKLIQAMFEMAQSRVAVMTEDIKGAVATDGSYLYRVGIFPNVKVIDETGAGDAFGAGFIAGLIEKNDVLYALRLASANASANVEEIGGSTGTLRKRDFKKKRWDYINLDVDKL